MFISNVTQPTKVSFNASTNRELKLGKRFLRNIYNGDLAQKIGVEVPKSKEEESKLLSDFFKNRFLIMLSQDTWAEKLKVRMPNSDSEKSAVVEFLEKRKDLDSYTRMTNERGRIEISKNMLSHLLAKEPNSPLITQLKNELAKRGNIDTVLATLKKKIAQAEAKHKPAMDYFQGLRKLEEKYEENGLISDTDLNAFWVDVEKNNLNKDGKLNTQELLDIVAGKKSDTEKVKTAEYSDFVTEMSEKCLNILNESWNDIKNLKKIVDKSVDTTSDSFKIIEKKLEETNDIIHMFVNQYNIQRNDLIEILLGKKTVEDILPNVPTAECLKLKQALKQQKINIAEMQKNDTFKQMYEFIESTISPKIKKTENVVKDVAPAVVTETKIISKKQLLANAKSEFEGYLRKNIDFYRVMNDNFILSEQQKVSKTGSQPDVVTISIAGVADKAHKAIYDKYALSIDKNKADDDLLKVFSKILNTYRMNAGKIGNMVLEMRNVGAYWRYMERDGIVELKGYKDKIADLEHKLKLSDADKDLIKEYSQVKVRLLNESDYVEALKDIEEKLADNTNKNQSELVEKLTLLKQELEKTTQYNEKYADLEKRLKSVNGSEKELRELIDIEYKMAENKYIWTQYLERAVEAEAFNRQSAAEQKCVGIYNYITGENASIKNYRALDEIRKENGGKLPEEVWDKILTFANEDGTISKEAWEKILA